VIQDARFASLYRSRPRSPIAQPDFLNTALVGTTMLAPLELLRLGKDLEALAGRRPGPVDGPRPLDIDILLFGEETIDSGDLVVPHPRLRERRFVLAPLAELEPAWSVPPEGVTVSELLAMVGQEADVERLGQLC
jgi:2-amino-4-hydroxy-6-hydroxymethyldihydropteridine diphosphokinase